MVQKDVNSVKNGCEQKPRADSNQDEKKRNAFTVDDMKRLITTITAEKSVSMLPKAFMKFCMMNPPSIGCDQKVEDFVKDPNGPVSSEKSTCSFFSCCVRALKFVIPYLIGGIIAGITLYILLSSIVKVQHEKHTKGAHVSPWHDEASHLHPVPLKLAHYSNFMRLEPDAYHESVSAKAEKSAETTPSTEGFVHRQQASTATLDDKDAVVSPAVDADRMVEPSLDNTRTLTKPHVTASSRNVSGLMTNVNGLLRKVFAAFTLPFLQMAPTARRPNVTQSFTRISFVKSLPDHHARMTVLKSDSGGRTRFFVRDFNDESMTSSRLPAEHRLIDDDGKREVVGDEDQSLGSRITPVSFHDDIDDKQETDISAYNSPHEPFPRTHLRMFPLSLAISRTMGHSGFKKRLNPLQDPNVSPRDPSSESYVQYMPELYHREAEIQRLYKKMHESNEMLTPPPRMFRSRGFDRSSDSVFARPKFRPSGVPYHIMAQLISNPNIMPRRPEDSKHSHFGRPNIHMDTPYHHEEYAENTENNEIDIRKPPQSDRYNVGDTWSHDSPPQHRFDNVFRHYTRPLTQFERLYSPLYSKGFAKPLINDGIWMSNEKDGDDSNFEMDSYQRLPVTQVQPHHMHDSQLAHVTNSAGHHDNKIQENVSDPQGFSIPENHNLLPHSQQLLPSFNYFQHVAGESMLVSDDQQGTHESTVEWQHSDTDDTGDKSPPHSYQGATDSVSQTHTQSADASSQWYDNDMDPVVLEPNTGDFTLRVRAPEHDEGAHEDGVDTQEQIDLQEQKYNTVASDESSAELAKVEVAGGIRRGAIPQQRIVKTIISRVMPVNVEQIDSEKPTIITSVNAGTQISSHTTEDTSQDEKKHRAIFSIVPWLSRFRNITRKILGDLKSPKSPSSQSHAAEKVPIETKPAMSSTKEGTDTVSASKQHQEDEAVKSMGPRELDGNHAILAAEDGQSVGTAVPHPHHTQAGGQSDTSVVSSAQ